MSLKKRVCVYCGSKTGTNGSFKTIAQQLGHQLASNHIGLVYGGGSVGLMNEIADATLSRGGQVHGVIPQHLYDLEVAHEQLTALHITDTMHERKAMMAELSDAFIALPGGFGTFEELMEVITWKQLGIHHKTVILFNIDGYYDKLINFLDHSVDNGFITEENRALLKVADDVDQCLSYLPFFET
ncbi:TIGR00730 family Rossman fold protein [Fodinibius halophilus]|uniref:Cytokinin riboside 5'-monophosphate phosphoribohydrolase n=1 Tax=Fodinibius halophilus TaxID=1736908 RepID=A0A6M1T6A3_9BACT|nr:TIGR00730 family Rossman fold protein [Fodinibius halophilus]NGP86794.1 TIGR00730 family Rossman fold protein [Fodinibius halophilus]